MKRILALLAATAATASAFTVECLPMYGNFIAGQPNQPCIRIKVTATAGEKITGMHFTTGKTSAPANITKATLCRTGSLRQFSPNAIAANQPKVVATTTTASVGSMVFNTPITLNAGDNYFWLCYDVASNAKGNNKIGAQCVALTNGSGQYVLPVAGKDGTQGTPGKVYEFKQRIAPYHRARYFAENSYGVVHANHFKYSTDYILFGLTPSGTSVTYYGCTQAQFKSAVSKAKQLRGSGACHIIAGFTVEENTMNPADTGSQHFGAVINDSTRRRELAKNLAKILIDNGFEGVDIDYEYPAQSYYGTWDNFSEFVTDLREELAGTGMSLSLAFTVRYDKPSPRVYDQADYVHLMSYGAPGEHETMALMESDVAWVRGAGIPDAKIVPGLGFFARDTETPHADSGGILYAGIIAQYPSLAASANTFINKKDNNKQYYFNGANMVKTKCQYVIKQKLGGVIIWGFDGDMPITNSKSLSKAMYTVLKQTKR